jgi:hypothetical protein
METAMSRKTTATALPHRTARAAVVAGLMTLSLTTAAFANAGPDDALLHASRQFEFSNREVKTIWHHGDMRDYRVCVRDVRHSYPVKVVHDSQTSLVYPGNCADFDAHKIALTAGAKLPSDTVLMGRYEFSKG